MAEYINKKTAISLIKQYGRDAIDGGRYSLDTVDDCIELEHRIKALPTEDVAPAVHGRWIEREDPMLDTYCTCSACNEDFYIEQTGDPVKDLFTYTYCPSCGAKMDIKDGGDNDAAD